MISLTMVTESSSLNKLPAEGTFDILDDSVKPVSEELLKWSLGAVKDVQDIVSLQLAIVIFDSTDDLV